MRFPTLFLDRDGTINVDIGPEYVSRPEQLKLIPGAARGIAMARSAGYRLAVITNQAGVAKGLTPPEALPAVHRQLERLIAQEGGLGEFHFDDIRVCPHHPDMRCRCRKPEPGMLEESIAALHADVERSFFIGDKEGDLVCSGRLGMRSILVRTGHGAKTEPRLAEWPEARVAGVADDLEAAVQLALRLSQS